MTAHMKTAPDGTPERLRKRVRAGELNSSEDGTNHPKHQASIEELDRLIDLSQEWERALARRQIMARRRTLNLILYRNNLLDLGKAVAGA